jgi:hypothetical protein
MASIAPSDVISPNVLVKDLFSNQGKAWMKRAALPVADRTLLDEDLALHTYEPNLFPRPLS